MLLHSPYSFSSNHPFPGLVVCAHTGIEVPEEDESVCPGCCRNHRIQIVKERVNREINTSDNCFLGIAIIYSLRCLLVTGDGMVLFVCLF